MATTPIQLLELEVAAAILAISPHTLRRWVREGRVPCVRLSSRAVRFEARALEEWVEARRQSDRPKLAQTGASWRRDLTGWRRR